MRAVVIGAGVIGASLAYRLAEKGARVTVLEAQRPAGGTSASTFAWANAHGKSPREYFDLNLAGMREHRRVAEELGGTWFNPGGDLEWADDVAGVATLRGKVARLQEWGYPIEWRTAAELRRLEPDLTALPDDATVAHSVEDGWVDPAPMTAQLLAAAKRHGATVRTGTAVTEMNVASGRVSAAWAGGEWFSADLFVNCGGPRAGELAELAGSSLPMRTSLGLLLVTEPVATTLRHVVPAPPVYFRPAGAGRLMLGSRAADRADLPQGDPTRSTIARELLGAVRRVLPALEGVELETARVGRRAIPADGLPAVGYLPGLDNFYAVVTHSGVTLSLHLGRLVAEELIDGVTDPSLVPLRPDRLLAAA